MLCLFPKAYASDPVTITPVGKMVIFKTWFSNMARECQFGNDFSDTIDDIVDTVGGNWATVHRLVSCRMVDKYHRGNCRNFSFCVARELSRWKIKNCLISFKDLSRPQDTGGGHVANVYVSPTDSKLMVADLTLAIKYKNDPICNKLVTEFSCLPFKLYTTFFCKGT